MIYEYKCLEDGKVYEYLQRGEHKCPEHGSLLNRKFSFTTSAGFQPHYNNSVGQYVSTQQEFHDALRRGSDEASERSGIPHNYQPVYPGDVKVTEEGKYETEKAVRDAS